MADLIRRHGQDSVAAEDELVRRLLSSAAHDDTEAEILSLLGSNEVDWQLALTALVRAHDTAASPRLLAVLKATRDSEVRDSVAVTLGHLGDAAAEESIANLAATAVEEGRPQSLRLVGALAQLNTAAAVDLAAKWLASKRSIVFSREETALQPLLSWLWEGDPAAVADLTTALVRDPQWPMDRWSAVLERWAARTHRRG
ncbi:MAG: hypothetical protein A2V84_05545 [Chloroflexi bacterium RBG_16_70_13]|nr:MAG: hypothetical protein A2V84_05545 [Chloroflexi bacterium RBG_16_70_13]